MNERTNKNIYYAGIELAKDLKMCEVFDKIESNHDAIILSHGRKVNIIECKYTNTYSPKMEPTGAEHLGFEFHFITVYYRGIIWSIQPATYYPFTDVNNPGEINATPYLLVDGNKKIQCGYSQPFNTLEELRTPPKSPLKDVYANPITYHINDFIRIFKKQAGNREKDIYNAPNICFEVQNDNGHKVIRCAKLERDPDGVRRYFDIDIIGEKITG